MVYILQHFDFCPSTRYSRDTSVSKHKSFLILPTTAHSPVMLVYSLLLMDIWVVSNHRVLQWKILCIPHFVCVDLQGTLSEVGMWGSNLRFCNNSRMCTLLAKMIVVTPPTCVCTIFYTVTLLLLSSRGLALANKMWRK